MEKTICRRNKKIIVLGAILLVLAGVLAFNWLSIRWDARRFSSTRLFFNVHGFGIFSYEFPGTRAVVVDDYRPEAKDAFYINHPTGDTGFGDVAASGDGNVLYFIERGMDATFSESIAEISQLDLSLRRKDAFVKVPESLAEIEHFALSPDHKYAVFVVCTERQENFLQGQTKHVLEFRNDGRFYCRSSIYIMEIENLKYYKIEDDADESRPCWFPDSTSILYGDGAGDKICRYNLPNGPAELVREGSFPSLSPDGSMMAYFYDRKFCWGRVSSETPEHTFQYQRLFDMTRLEAGIEPMSLWSPDGKYLLLSLWGEWTFVSQYPFFAPAPWNKFFILDVETGRIVYRDKIRAGLLDDAIWVRKNSLLPNS